MSPLAKAAVVALIFAGVVLDEHRLTVVRDQVEQARSDIQTQQQQIAADQAQIRRLEDVVQTMLTNQANTSASVTTIPAAPYCNLHDIQVQNPGC